VGLPDAPGKPFRFAQERPEGLLALPFSDFARLRFQCYEKRSGMFQFCAKPGQTVSTGNKPKMKNEASLLYSISLVFGLFIRCAVRICSPPQ
jgi:hypothetical protein